MAEATELSEAPAVLAGVEPTAGVSGGPITVSQILFSISRKSWFVYAVAMVCWFLLLFVTTWDGGVNWVEGWHRWDANWYQQIWQDGWGYDPHTLAFVPIFPWLSGALSWILRTDFDHSSLILNIFCYFFAGVISAEYVSRRARVSKWVLYAFHLCSPVAFYAVMPYTDALFYLVFWVALIMAEQYPLSPKSRSEFAAEFLFMFMLPLVRITSFAFAVWLLFRRWFAAAVLLTLALILILNWKITGEPLYFLRVQEEFAMPRGWFINGLVQTWRDYMSPGTRANLLFLFQVSILPVLSMVLIFVSSLWMARRREFFWIATMLAVALMSRNQAYWRSVLRYDLPLTPLIAASWAAWLRPLSDGNQLKRWLRPALAAILVGALLAGALFCQLSVGHHVHLGGWGY